MVIYMFKFQHIFYQRILEAFCLENIKLKFNNEGQLLDAILIQIAKIKLNSVHIDFLYENDIKHDVDK